MRGRRHYGRRMLVGSGDSLARGMPVLRRADRRGDVPRRTRPSFAVVSLGARECAGSVLVGDKRAVEHPRKTERPRRETAHTNGDCFQSRVAETLCHVGGCRSGVARARELYDRCGRVAAGNVDRTYDSGFHAADGSGVCGRRSGIRDWVVVRGAVRTSLQYLALVWGVLFAVAFGWAWLPPDFIAPWLHRLVVTVVALAAVVVVYGFGLVKFLRRENEWTRAAARLVPSLAVLAAALIFVVLGIEVVDYVEQGEVPIVSAALIAVVAALGGLAVAALTAALAPGRDPLGLSERGRTLYVYLAEGLAALLLLHIRVTMPWLFRGWFLRFWPLVVMAIAFVGVGLSEVFRRRKERVLYEPLENTGAILPLLPVLGFWVVSSQVHYSLLLLAIGVLYASLSVLRRSFLYGVLAALAANGSLWYLLHRWEGLDITEHPQLWLIPPAPCALVAGYINRERLTPQQSAALRYASAIVIYVSSTADIFINGVAEAPWLPGVLAGLSILGACWQVSCFACERSYTWAQHFWSSR